MFPSVARAATETTTVTFRAVVSGQRCDRRSADAVRTGRLAHRSRQVSDSKLCRRRLVRMTFAEKRHSRRLPGFDSREAQALLLIQFRETLVDKAPAGPGKAKPRRRFGKSTYQLAFHLIGARLAEKN